MSDKEQMSSPSDKVKNEYLEVKGSANTIANLMRPKLPQITEMAGTFEKLKHLKSMIKEHTEKEQKDEPDSTKGIEDKECEEDDNTVTIRVNNTVLGQFMTLDESDSDESDHDETHVINDIALVTSSDDDDDGDDDDSDDDVTIPSMFLSKNLKRTSPLIRPISDSESEGEVDSTDRTKRQKLE